MPQVWFFSATKEGLIWRWEAPLRTVSSPKGQVLNTRYDFLQPRHPSVAKTSHSP